MHQRRSKIRLVDELRDDGLLARELGAQALDDERPAEPLGAERSACVRPCAMHALPPSRSTRR
jgi:hypothetical protein